MSDPLWGYSQVTVLQLLTHLHETYGTITPDQLDENAVMLDREWNPNDPLERLWQRVRECCSFAHVSDDTISEAAAVCKTLNVFANSARDCRKLPSIERTWANLQKHFKVVNDECKRLLTTEGAGCHSDNAAQASAQLEQAMDAVANLTAADQFRHQTRLTS